MRSQLPWALLVLVLVGGLPTTGSPTEEPPAAPAGQADLTPAEQHMLDTYRGDLQRLLEQKHHALSAASDPVKRQMLEHQIQAVTTELTEIEELRRTLRGEIAPTEDRHPAQPDDTMEQDHRQDVLEKNIDQRLPEYSR